MKEQISKRIEELAAQINKMIADKQDMQRKIKHIDDEVLKKSGAIFELKSLLDKEKD